MIGRTNLRGGAGSADRLGIRPTACGDKDRTRLHHFSDERRQHPPVRGAGVVYFDRTSLTVKRPEAISSEPVPSSPAD